MPKSLRSILGKTGRVSKPGSSPTKRTPSSPSPRKTVRKPKEDDDGDYFQEKLEDVGLTQLLSEELTLRDVVQAMRYVRSRMFTPVPQTGFHSARTAELLNYRVSMPPIVTVGHLNAVLSSPTKVEREMAELTSKGVIRRVRIERRGGMGEALVEMSDLVLLVQQTGTLSRGTKERFVQFLGENTTAQTVSRGAMEDGHTDELIRAGFLTSATRAGPESTLHVRPEDRTTLTSIQHVSQFASGTVSAVGGRNAIHLAGGGGGGGGGYRSTPGAESSSAAAPAFRVSIPGHGRYLKLAAGAVDWVRETLGKTKWGEGPESWLRERFEGGGLYGTRWKDFWGLEWEWVLGEAVGLGVVEVFETGSVGRGVRALGG